MATIQSQTKLYESMSTTLRRMTTVMDVCTVDFERLQVASGQTLSLASVSSYQGALSDTSAVIGEMSTGFAQTEDGAKAVSQALDVCTVGFDKLQVASEQTLSLARVSGYQEELSETSTVIREITTGFEQAEDAAKGVAQTVGEGTGAVDGMLGKIGKMGKQAFSIENLKKVLELSDELTSAQTKLSIIVDDEGSVAELEGKIFGSAQRSRTSYMTMMDTVSTLGMTAGDAFSSNEELLHFAELMNKNFVITGVPAAEQGGAMEPVTQAMATGSMDSGGYQALLETAPLLAQSIEEYMTKTQGVEGSIQDWADQGLLTADVIKTALFSSAEEVETRLAQTPTTWAQAWTGMESIATRVFQPILDIIGGIASHLDIILPLVTGFGAAFLVFQIAANWTTIAATAMGIYTAATAIYNGVMGFLSLGFGVLTGSTAAASAATFTFNSALLASPITWVVMLVLALVGVFFAVVAAINKFAGTSISATGVIFGAFSTLWALIYNTVLVPWQNTFATLANNIGNLFHNPVGAIKVMFIDLVKTIFENLLSMAKAAETFINKIPGVEINVTAGMEDFYKQLEVESQNAKSEAEWVEYVSKWEAKDYGETWDKGYANGEAFDERVSNAFSPKTGYGPEALVDENGNPIDLGQGNVPSSAMDDINGLYNTENDAWSDTLVNDQAATAENTGSTAASVKTVNEDLDYMRDVAEREAINRFTTSEIKVDMTGMSNRIDSSMDIDGVISRFTNGVREALITSAEGVHQ